MKKNLDVTKPFYSERILPVSWHFVISRLSLPFSIPYLKIFKFHEDPSNSLISLFFSTHPVTFLSHIWSRFLDINVHVTFTSLDANGREGPNNTSGYKGSQLEGKVQLVAGIQIWSVPVTGLYRITAWGASGGNGTGASPRLGGSCLLYTSPSPRD